MRSQEALEWARKWALTQIERYCVNICKMRFSPDINMMFSKYHMNNNIFQNGVRMVHLKILFHNFTTVRINMAKYLVVDTSNIINSAKISDPTFQVCLFRFSRLLKNMLTILSNRFTRNNKKYVMLLRAYSLTD